MAYFSFDTSDIESGLIPDGTVLKVSVVDSDIVERDWGLRMPVTVEVLEGQWQGTRISDGYNIKHHKPKVQAIGQKQLKRLCEAVGVERFKDTHELHGKPFMLTVKIEAGTGGYDDSNKFAKMEACADAAVPSNEDGKAPWEL
tara:strand:- start:113 stop:541 length:429 start_codon:yes stop_codon:yes gene_type:complete